jgi:hypothetical protein
MAPAILITDHGLPHVDIAQAHVEAVLARTPPFGCRLAACDPCVNS